MIMVEHATSNERAHIERGGGRGGLFCITRSNSQFLPPDDDF